MQEVLISIKPKWCEFIAEGKKTVEVRKTRPKIEPPFKVYIYCTKQGKQFFHGGIGEKECLFKNPDTEKIKFDYSFELMCCKNEYTKDNFLSGKVIGEFVCDKIYQYSTSQNCKGIDITDEEMTKASCLTKREIEDYEFSAEAKDYCIYKIGVYGWHISDLVIYDKPRELSEFKTPEWFRDCKKGCNDMEYMRCPTKDSHKVDKMCGWCRKGGKPITRAPQSWCYVEV